MRPGDVVLGRFRIEGVAGQGAFGEVYRATDLRSGEPTAVKRLAGASRPERFAREIAVLSELSHPDIVRYVAHGTESGATLLVMEWLDGQPLGARLRRGAPPIEEACAYVLALSRALAGAHALGIVHRDVKPSNVMLSGAGLKLLDFGLARRFTNAHEDGDGERLTGAAELLGTPGYMAPEQVRGEDVDARADVFGLGCVAYECLTGAPAFRADGVLELLDRVLHAAPRHPSDVRTEVPSGIGDVVLEMLAKVPDERPADGRQAHGRLLAAMRQAGISVRRPPEHAPERRLATVAVLDLEDDRAALADLLREGEAAVVSGASDAFAFATGSAKVQALRAVRWALALRRVAPAARVAIAMGRTAEGPVPAAPIVARARALLREASRRSGAEPGVTADDVVATLLSDHVSVAPSDAGAWRVDESAAPRELRARSTPFVGRERELRTLLACAEDVVAEERSLAALVTGEPGMGKTRLVAEFSRRLEGHRWAVVLARADPLATGAAFGVLKQLVEALSVGLCSDRARADLAALAEGALAAEEGDSDRLVRHRVRREAWVSVLRDACSRRPVALMLEDVHWADDPSLRLIEAALVELRDAALLVVATARAELSSAHARLWSSADVQHVALRELGRKASRRLVQAVLAGIAEEELERLVDAAGGHPLYLEELVRAKARGGPGGAEGAAALAQSALDALSPRERQFAQAASVLGEVFWPECIAPVLGLSAEDLEEVEASLTERGLVVARASSRFDGKRELAFRHALVRDAAYESSPSAVRTRAHLAAAEWLERIGERDAAVLASHYDMGRERGRAARWYWTALRAAYDAHDARAVLGLGERGSEVCDDPLTRAQFRYFAAESLIWLGVPDERAQRYLGEVMASNERDGELWVAAAGAAAFASAMSGRTVPDELLSALLSFEPRASASGAACRALGACMSALYATAQREAAVRVRDRVRALPEREAGPGRAVVEAQWRALEARWSGRPFAGLLACRDAIAAYRQAQWLGDIPFAECEMVLCSVGIGAEVTREAGAALERAEQLGATLFVPILAGGIACDAAREGDWARARQFATAAERACARGGDLVLAPLALALIAMARLDVGDDLAAEAAAGRIPTTGHDGRAAFVSAVRAEVALRRGDRRHAAAEAERARAAADARAGFVLAEPRIAGTLARIAEARGDQEAATVERARARALATRASEDATDTEVRARYLAHVDRLLA